VDVEQLQAELLDLGQDPVHRWRTRSARQTPRLAKSCTLRRAGGLSGPGRFSRTV
jgi:hypothetical protein